MRVCAVSMIVTALCGGTFGQENSVAAAKTISINGRANDATGAGIGSGTVKLNVEHFTGNNPFASSKLDKDGKFMFPAVPRNKYVLIVEVPGFKVFRKTIDTGDGRDIDMGNLHIELGSIIDTIELSGVPKYPSKDLAQFVIDNLDVTSFPSSIGPRRVEGKTSFRDYGIVPLKVSESEAALEEKDGSWSFHITILSASPDGGVFVCFEDRGKYPARYHSQNALWLVRRDFNSKLKAQEIKVANSKCPAFAK